MTYKAICGIPKSTCTAEQKIAYNLAFAHSDCFIKEYERMPMQFQKSEVIHYAIRKMLEWYQAGYDYTAKYDIDSIQCCLNAGLENYFKAPHKILTSYEEIGKMFPAYYL